MNSVYQQWICKRQNKKPNWVISSSSYLFGSRVDRRGREAITKNGFDANPMDSNAIDWIITETKRCRVRIWNLEIAQFSIKIQTFHGRQRLSWKQKIKKYKINHFYACANPFLQLWKFLCFLMSIKKKESYIFCVLLKYHSWRF